MAILKGSASKDTLTGGTANDVLYGYGDNDVLNGLAGNDILNGGLGVDTLNGGAGSDTYIVDNIGDIINEGSGKGSGMDTVKTSVSYTLGANLEKLVLTGTAASGTGNGLPNTITGNAANNVLNGDAGNDVLDGRLGVDTLMGGSGNDILKLNGFLGDSVNGGLGIDTLQLSVGAKIADGTIKNVEHIQYVGFTAGVDEITIDFGGKAYTDTGVSKINLTGFGLEDKLIIAQHDGILNAGTAHYHISNRNAYIHEVSISSTWMGSDKIAWQVGSSKAQIISRSGFPPHSGSPSHLSTIGSIQITGLPTGLPDSQFIFV